MKLIKSLGEQQQLSVITMTYKLNKQQHQSNTEEATHLDSKQLSYESFTISPERPYRFRDVEERNFPSFGTNGDLVGEGRMPFDRRHATVEDVQRVVHA